MKILFLTPQLPYPPHQGTTIRNYNLMRALAQRYTIDLLTFLAPGATLDASNPLHTLCRRVIALPQPSRSATQRILDTLRSPRPDMGLRLDYAPMHKLVQQWVQEEAYDLVQIEGIEMAQYGLRAAGTKREGAQSAARSVLIFDDHNCEYLLQKRNALTDVRLPRRWPAAAYSLVQWQKLVRYERQICRQADAVLAVSEADKVALQALAPAQSITVIANGIHMADYALDPWGLCAATDQYTAKSQGSKGSNGGQFTLVFTGKMDYRPNIDAVLWFGCQVLPLIQAQVPTVCFQIVGLNPHARLDELRANPAIEIVGAVPDAQPYIRAAAVYVIPLRVGGGTRFKALEAMACAKPIVSTSLGVEGIGVQDQRELLLADTAQAFADAVLRLLRDGEAAGTLSQQLGDQARRFVASHYDWAQIVPQLETVYQAVLAQSKNITHRQV